MIDRTHTLAVTRQAKLLQLSRASVYYTPAVIPDAELTLMRRIDELHLELPFAGSRMLRDLLQRGGIEVGRAHVRTLMRRLRITALYQRPKTTERHRAYPVFPYLRRTLTVTRPNHVWAADMEDALARYGCPEIFNTDQGSQFTSAEFLNVLRRRQIAISMDGKGCWRDNVFVERLWRSVKYEEVYLHGYETVSDVRTGLTRYFQFFNQRRPHRALARRTPDQVFLTALPELLAPSSRATPLISAA
jgi:putative transposase